MDWEKSKNDKAMPVKEFWGYSVNPLENSKRQEISGFEFRLTNTGFKDVCKGFNINKVAKALKKHGLLLSSSGKSTYPKTDPRTKKQVRFYIIKGEILTPIKQPKSERETLKLGVVV